MTSVYDRLFLERFNSEFETYLITFVRPTQAPEGTKIIQLHDLGRPFRNKKLNDLRIVIATIWRIVQFRNCLNWLKPDIVIGSWVTTYGLYASASRWKPFVLFAYGSDIQVDPNRSPLHRYITTRVISSPDLVLIDSNVQRKAILLLGCSPQKIVSFPWIDQSDLDDVKADSNFRDRLRWHDKTIVVSTRLHEPIYAIDTFIRAIPVVIAHSPNVRFLIFGDGTQKERLIRLVQELRVESYVHFAGSVPRKRLLCFVKDCDIYASTSLSDGCSSSLLEAMFLRIPVVVTSIPGNLEWVSDRVTGLLVQPLDPEGLAQAILWLKSNPEKTKRMVRNAVALVRYRVDWGGALDELISRMLQVFSTYK